MSSLVLLAAVLGVLSSACATTHAPHHAYTHSFKGGSARGMPYERSSTTNADGASAELAPDAKNQREEKRGVDAGD